MITISKPYIKRKNDLGGGIFLVSEISDDIRGLNADLWFSVENKYGDYLCDELADCFLLSLLPIAVKHNQSIIVKANVSPKLLYNIRTCIEPMYQRIFNKSGCTKIYVEGTKLLNFNGNAFATGCSLGVDSLSSIFHHLENNGIEGFRLTHLTLFNSGQLGDYDLEASEKNFYNTVEEIRPFADSLGLPIIAINSNLNSFYKDSGIYVLQTVALRTMSFAMSIQKLIRRYAFGSTYPLDSIRFDCFDTEHHEAAFLSLLSTENFQPILSDPFATRVEKTKYIIDKPLVSKFLKVCWAEQTAYEVWHNTSFLNGKTKTNCGWCDKCLRTLLTIEVLKNGDLNDYREQFELNRYYEHRNMFIKKIFEERSKNIYYQEIVNLIISRKYPIPFGIRMKYILKLKATTELKQLLSVVLIVKYKMMSVLRRLYSKVRF